MLMTMTKIKSKHSHLMYIGGKVKKTPRLVVEGDHNIIQKILIWAEINFVTAAKWLIIAIQL